MRMTERMHRRDFGHLDTEVTIDDPAFYSKPITFRYTATLVPGDDLLESVCTENEKDGVHFKPEAAVCRHRLGAPYHRPFAIRVSAIPGKPKLR